ncbi:MAG: serine/threonine protein kinase, partial [Planctomycetes bacterium]|nr:serine/threonine protein kinase [Planctomycetota bacterium]
IVLLPALDGLRGWSGGLGDVIASANAMRALIAGRPGVVRAYVSWPDGRLTGVERSGAGWDLMEMEPVDDGIRISRRPLGRDGGLAQPAVSSVSGYDVRKRPWWRAAVDAASGRAWTDPYLLKDSGQPGISCSEAMRDAEGRILAVMSVDFELSAIGAAFAFGGPGRGAHILFDAQRTLISVPEEWAAELPRERLLAAADLRYPEAAGLFKRLDALPAPGSTRREEWTQDGIGYGAAVQAVPVDGGPVWYLAQIIPDHLLSGSVDSARRSSLLIGFPAALLGAGLSIWYARLFSRSRREAEAMRQRAQAAEAELRQIGAYRLVRKLGEGGMGEVWLGMHRMLARPAAIKRITAARLTGEDGDNAKEARARFATEARITASLRSRNTIELFDYGTTPEGGFYYVMELLDGLDLAALVEKHGPVPVGRAISILVQVCGSLAEAHDRGLVHRDIKPENIYVCRRADEVDVVKVLDFGIVAVQSRELSANVSKAGFVVGTPQTMSPEQARGEKLDGRSDIYALGCVAFWLLTGSTVFLEEEQLPQVLAHLNDAPEAPSNRAGRILPDGLDTLVLSCLAKSREMRPADARALAAALRAIPVPADERWDDGTASAWWAEHIPPAPTGVLDQEQPRSASFTDQAPA